MNFGAYTICTDNGDAVIDVQQNNTTSNQATAGL